MTHHFWTRKLWLALALLTFCLSLSIGPLLTPRTMAAVTSLAMTTVEGSQIPDWSRISLANLPQFLEGGSVNVSSSTARAGSSASNITWSAGQKPADVLRLGNLQELLPQSFSLENISRLTGLSLGNLKLSDFGLLKDQTPADLVKAIPGLGSKALEQVKPLQDLFRSSVSGETVAQAIANNPTVAATPLGQGMVDLKRYSLGNSIPGLSTAQLGKFNDWESGLFAEIPGLNNVPLGSFPQPLSNRGGVVKVASVFLGPQEANRLNAFTGVRNRAIPCRQDSCAHLEMEDGTQFVSGKSQQVDGGSGIFRGKEPTGIHPFGSAFKTVYVHSGNNDEKAGSGMLALYFRFCTRFGCSPYRIGPVPFLTVRETEPVFLGLLPSNVSSASSQPTSSQTQGSQTQPSASNNQAGSGTNPNPSPSNTTSASSPNGVDSQTVKAVVAAVPTGQQSVASFSVREILEAALEQGITDQERLASLLAIAGETSGFGTDMEQSASVARNNTNPGLGNTNSEDAVLFRARGYLGLTGRDNYLLCGNKIGVNLIAEPDLAARSDVAAKILVGCSNESVASQGSNTSRYYEALRGLFASGSSATRQSSVQ